MLNVDYKIIAMITNKQNETFFYTIYITGAILWRRGELN